MTFYSTKSHNGISFIFYYYYYHYRKGRWTKKTFLVLCWNIFISIERNKRSIVLSRMHLYPNLFDCAAVTREIKLKNKKSTVNKNNMEKIHFSNQNIYDAAHINSASNVIFFLLLQIEPSAYPNRQIYDDASTCTSIEPSNAIKNDHCLEQH